MNETVHHRAQVAKHGMSFGPFVTFTALLMAINALGIDIMLPAVPDMTRQFSILEANQGQWIVASYVLGFGAAPIFFGPIADRFGRRPLLLFALGLFAASSLAILAAPSFTIVVISRFMQGAAAAATRVAIVAIVRDSYSGDAMAKVLSLAFGFLIFVPIVAPGIGQAILFVAPWHWIFAGLTGFALLLGICTLGGLRETLDPDDRRPIALGPVLQSARLVLRDRRSLGYTLAAGLMTASAMAYINSIQQIFADIFRAPTLFPVVFACCGATMGLSLMLNARLVGRLGARTLAHVALSGFILFLTLNLLAILLWGEPLIGFALLQSATMACFAVATANFAAIAMQPMGRIAGMVASVQGTIQHLLAALVGIAISQAYNGTIVPLIGGNLMLGLAALAIVLTVERGRLFMSLEANA